MKKLFIVLFISSCASYKQSADRWKLEYALFDCNNGCKRVNLFKDKKDCEKYRVINFGAEQSKMGCFKVYIGKDEKT